MRYTPIHPAYAQEVRDCQNFMKKHPASFDTTLFSLHRLKITPYKYQHHIWKYFNEKNRIIIAKSRQIGVSTALEVFAIHAALSKKFKSGLVNNTKIGIVSKSNDQAKKVLRDIKNFMHIADAKNMEDPLLKDFFKNSIDINAPNNMFEINFLNKSFIKCFPPTDVIRGNTLDIVIVDEAAFVPDDIFRNAIAPTVSKTNGKIILSSTPKGQKGYFYEIFDPEDVYKTHEYTRFWFHWKQCEDEVQKRIIRQEYKMALRKGTLIFFDQEYNAKFVSDIEAFFDSLDVDRAVDRNLALEYSWHESPCSLALDYGMTKSETTLTVKTKHKGVVMTLFQWGWLNFDLNLLMDSSFEHSVPNLLKRYDIRTIIVDDCPEGFQINKQMENNGWPVRRFDFRGGEKNRAFFTYKSALKKGLVKFPEFKDLIVQMKQLIGVKMEVAYKITHPKDGMDDRVVGEVLASLPFIEEEGSFESFIIVPSEEAKEQNNYFTEGRRDLQWEQIIATHPEYYG